MTVGVDELKPCYLNAAQDNKVPVSDFGALEEKLKQQLEEACKKLWLTDVDTFVMHHDKGWGYVELGWWSFRNL